MNIKRILLSGLAALTLVGTIVQAGPTPYYVVPAGTTINYTNNGIDVNPVIDAINFINYGTFVTGTVPLPFETFDTLNYTNFGTILGLNGFRFDLTSNSTGKRYMAANFINPNPGTITAIDPPSFSDSITFVPCSLSPVQPSYLLISATNIVIGGGQTGAGPALTVGANGILDLEGSSVNLSYSTLQSLPVWGEPQGTFFTGPPPTVRTSFYPDIGIYDLYWVQNTFNDTYYALGSRGLWNGVTATAQPVIGPTIGPTLPNGQPGFSITDPYADSYILSEELPVTITNAEGTMVSVTLLSNIVKGAVFVGVPAGFNVDLGFGADPTLPVTNPFLSIGVLMSTTLLDPITGQPEAAYIGFSDELASDQTISGVSLNNLYCSSPATSRPQCYQIQRASLGVGFAGNTGYPEPNFLIDSSQIYSPSVGTNLLSDLVTNFVLTAGSYAGYGAFVDNMASRAGAIAGGSVTNLPGRIQISADSLDLTQTRMRGQGFVVINTPHLVSSSNSIIDCENLSFYLGSTNGNLKVQNLVPGVATPRLRGYVVAWSASWTNSALVKLDNYTADTNVPPNYTQTPLTNAFTVAYDTLMLDASALAVEVPVNTFDFVTHSASVEFNDDMSIIQSLLIDGRSFTLNGSITIPGVYPPNPITLLSPNIQPLMNWNAANAPSLLYFTNNGTLSVVNETHFGDDRPPYADFINNGTIIASGISLNSYYFECGGSVSSAGALFVQGNTGKLQNGSAASGSFAQFNCNSLKLNNYKLNSGSGALSLYVTNALSDAGAGSGNVIQVQDGINLMIKPQSGDLIGTAINTIAPGTASGNASRVYHQWAGEDRGATPAGYLNNVAVGTLAMSALNTNSLLYFTGTGFKNGLYVDVLDLSGMTTNYLKQIILNPNLTIYYAAVKLPAGVGAPMTNNVQEEPEEYLDGQLGGHLRWVRDYAGPNSSVAVIINGQSVQVNQALRNSLIIDSDGNGTANGLQAQPFTGVPMVVQTTGSGTIAPNYNGQMLIQGLPYSMTATPADGFVFSGWTGATNTTSATISFVASNGASYTANFSFILAPGSYSGLFYESEPNGIEYLRSGYISVATSKGGRFSGSLQTAAKRYSFSGQLNTNGAASLAIPGSTMTMQFQAGSNTISGTIQSGTNWTANIQGDRAVFTARGNTPSFAGKYTILLPGTGDSTDTTDPQGTGYGSVTVDTKGNVKFAGSLPDGTKVTQTTTASADGQWPFFIPLYKGLGQILGWQTFASTPDQDLGGQFSWIKATNVVGKIYPNGFNYDGTATGSTYNQSNVPLIALSSGHLSLNGGNLADDITNSFTVDLKNKVTVSGGRKQSLKFNSSQGLFTGSVVDPNTGKPVKFNGAVFQRLSSGAGYFLGTNQSGSVLVTP